MKLPKYSDVKSAAKRFKQLLYANIYITDNKEETKNK